MALCVCKCLNITLESDKIEDILDLGTLEIMPIEQRDIFFNEKLMYCYVDTLKKQVIQPALVSERSVGRWILHSCVTCGQTTHGILQERNAPSMVVISKSTQTTADRINQLKKSNSYSPVFNLLVPEVTNDDVNMKENIDTNNMLIRDNRGWPQTHQVIGSLSKQLDKTLESKLEAVEETVRQFREQKYAEYEAYKERAKRDHKILTSIISKSRNNSENEGRRVDTSLDNGPPSPQLPPFQRRRLSSIKDAKKMHNFNKLKNNPPAEEDSLEAEELFFELEDTDHNNTMFSDNEDYDSDNGSNDEGMPIARPRGGGVDVARSVPVAISRVPNGRFSQRDLDDDEPATDIAASIKALARSVHGDVFELPPPRISTQI